MKTHVIIELYQYFSKYCVYVNLFLFLIHSQLNSYKNLFICFIIIIINLYSSNKVLLTCGLLLFYWFTAVWARLYASTLF